MKKMKKILFALTALLIAALLFNSCPNDDEEDDVDNGGGGGASGANLPFNWISVHPTSADYIGANPTIKPLTVVVSEDVFGGNFKFQWYSADSFTNSGGEAIESEEEEEFTPTEEGYYYVVVTRTKSGTTQTQTSNPARIRFLSAAPAAPTTTVTISSENRQYVRGFGGMSNAFGIGAPARYMEMRDIDTLFNPDNGLGLKILRIMIWPDPIEDVIRGRVEPQMQNQTTYLQAVKKVNEYGGYVMASPWTPPPDWKVNLSPNGTEPSYLLPQYYGLYAQYLADYAQAMADYGAPIYTLSIQNEPSYPASYAGCAWTSAQQLAFFKHANVGKFTKDVPGYGGGEATDYVKIMSGEPHQAVTWNNNVRNDSAAHALIDIYAFHTYGNHVNNTYTGTSSTSVQADNAADRKEVWMTEWNINSGSEVAYLQDSTWNFVWNFVDAVDNDVRCDSVNAFVWWYVKRFYGFIGDNSYGTVNGEVTPRGFAVSHYAKYATDTVRVPAVVTGHPGRGNANDASSTGYPTDSNPATVFVKASAFRRKAAPSTYWEQKVTAREDSISLVIYDKRTNAGTAEEAIRVNLPADFGAAKYAHAIISDSTGKRHAPHIVVLTSGGTTADFDLPANSIVSVKFFK